MGTTHRRRGFTSTDLILAIALAVLLVPLAVTTVLKAGDSANRVVCASNLKQIGQAILLYSNENAGQYPRTRYDESSAASPAAWTGTSTTRPFADDGPAANDVTAAFRLLLSTQDLAWQVFLCPSSPVSDSGFDRLRSLQAANFADERDLSYSFANPYPTKAASEARYKLTNALDANFAVAADINPGVNPPDSDVTAVTPASPQRDLRRALSPNHTQDGQNVLFGDGHVEFVTSPFVGVNGDNVFTFGRPGTATGVVGSPIDKLDSVLLPTMNPTLWTGHPYVRAVPHLPWMIFLPAIAIVVGVAGWQLVRRLRGRGTPLPSA